MGETLGLGDDGVWDAIGVLDAARERYRERTGKHTSLGETEARERAARYVRAMDPSVQGSNGSAALWRAATTLVHGFDIHPEHATEVLIDEFNHRCAPPWTLAELQRAAWRAHRTPERQPRGHMLRGGGLR